MERGPVRVAVMADTHGVLRPEVEKILETCDVIVHAGDFDTQMLYMKLSGKQPLFAVRGNNDRGWSGGLPGIKRFEIGGVKMVMAHQRTDIPVALGDAQVVIFGHSHMYQQQEIAGRLWLNPGSCGYKRNTLPLSMAVMTIEDGTYQVETIWLEKGYGTPGAAIAQREKTKVSKYEKKQKRYQQKQLSDANDAKEKELLFSSSILIVLALTLLSYNTYTHTHTCRLTDSVHTRVTHSKWLQLQQAFRLSSLEEFFLVCKINQTLTRARIHA